MTPRLKHSKIIMDSVATRKLPNISTRRREALQTSEGAYINSKTRGFSDLSYSGVWRRRPNKRGPREKQRDISFLSRKLGRDALSTTELLCFGRPVCGEKSGLCYAFRQINMAELMVAIVMMHMRDGMLMINFKHNVADGY